MTGTAGMTDMTGMAARVLIVDDDEDIRYTLRLLLEGAAYQVTEAEDGAAALRALDGSPEDMIVLLDNIMPVLGGDELLAVLETREPEAGRRAFILVTASPAWVSNALAERVARLDAPIIAKPFNLDTLLDAVAQAAARLR